MSDTLTYDGLYALLRHLGFEPVTTTGSHQVFKNPEWDAVILLPPTNASDPVCPHHLVSVRGIIAEKGILDRDAFDRLVAERAPVPT
jgi:predicted RNA binding protein YcfA (HicA-like mRNA interferase family)